MSKKAFSPRMEKYFNEINSKVKEAFEIATKARSLGFDPSDKVDIKLAKNLAERVVGLISVVAPQIEGTNVVPRIEELEEKYGKLDWRVAFIIALEVAQEKFCEFKDKREAMEVGIRVGFAYVTVGVVSSPLEGFMDLEIKKTRDGKDYFCLNFAGPIRNAGGTSASVSVLIADYVRKQMGYAKYDADEKEQERCYREIMDYHERITNLQYSPSKEEMIFLTKNIPVEISGIASEKIEVSNFKDLPRIPTNRIRSGYCLINSSCIPLKAPKLWKQLRKWGKDFEMEDWNFLEEFLHIQHESKSRKNSNKKTNDEGNIEEKNRKEEFVLPSNIKEIIDSKPKKIDPMFTYISDLVAGRPIFSHPSRSGGFRLRYGRSRTSGYSAQSLSPATLSVLDDFITTATQLKVERPGKATSITVCDSICGPVVLLKNGNVVEVETKKQGDSLTKDVKEILYLGDVLINYGDFFDRAHELCAAGYCEEWWVQELSEEINNFFDTDINFDEKVSKISELIKINVNVLQDIIKNPLKQKPSSQISVKLSKLMPKLPLHPKYIYFWNQIEFDDFVHLLKYFYKAKIDGNKLVISFDDKSKRTLELLGIPHFLAGEFITFDENVAFALIEQLKLRDPNKKLLTEFMDVMDKERELLIEKKIEKLDGDAVLFLLNKNSDYIIRDKAGTFIGARMGRPEKAKMRKMQPPPHGLFPVGKEGGRTRSFQTATEGSGIVNAEFELWWDEKEGQESIFPVNYKTNNKCIKKYWDNKEKIMVDSLDPEKRWIKSSKFMKYDFNSHFKWCLKKMNTKVYPDLIKGVTGTISSTHSPENPMKAILRAKYDVFVNKDGTVRYDGSEVPVTHFKPKEIGTSIEQLKKLGYTHDINNEPLTQTDQILELIPQDVILPACKESPNEPSDVTFFRTTKYIDEELKYLYGLDPYFNLKKPIDLAGHYIVVLAPHTSAGTIGRVIGFSATQGLYMHPLMHAAIRRDCDGDEGGVFLLMDAFLNFSPKYLNNRLGYTMDAPIVLTSILNPAEVDDMVFNMDINWKYNLDFYKACCEGKMPWDIKMHLVNDELDKEGQYEGYGFTHDTDDFNEGVKCSAYKTLPSMKEKLEGQMELGVKIRAVDESNLAKIVIEKHFIKDTKGNLRKFSQQSFRCTGCNTIFRRPPLSGKCTFCGKNSIIFTVAEGSIKKYVQYSTLLAEKYNVPEYLKETLELNVDVINSIFGKEKEKQEGLNSFFE